MQRVLSLNQALVESFAVKPQPAAQLASAEPQPAPLQPHGGNSERPDQAAGQPGMQRGKPGGVRCRAARDPDAPPCCSSRLPCIDEGARRPCQNACR